MFVNVFDTEAAVVECLVYVERFQRNNFCASADVPSRNCMAIV